VQDRLLVNVDDKRDELKVPEVEEFIDALSSARNTGAAREPTAHRSNASASA